jgi:hypothetical protein
VGHDQYFYYKTRRTRFIHREALPAPRCSMNADLVKNARCSALSGSPALG